MAEETGAQVPAGPEPAVAPGPRQAAKGQQAVPAGHTPQLWSTALQTNKSQTGHRPVISLRQHTGPLITTDSGSAHTTPHSTLRTCSGMDSKPVAGVKSRPVR